MILFRFSLKTAAILATTAVGLTTAASSHRGTFGTKRALDDASTDPADDDDGDGDVVTSFIVGGSDAGVGVYPYYAQLNILTDRGPALCGGALIAPDVVLSAAHCSDGFVSIFEYQVWVGAYRKSNPAEGAVVRNCIEWVNHPSYVDLALNDGTQNFGEGNLVGNDFALCRLNEPVAIDTTSVYLELNEDGIVPADEEELTIMGFGLTSADRLGPTASILQDVELPILNSSSCDQIYQDISNSQLNITDTMMCAWDEMEQKSECGGDSGGPLVLIETQQDGRSRHTLSGISSFSTSVCGQYPGVFARVSAGMDFIIQQVCVTWDIDAQFCPTSSPTVSPFDSPSRRPSASPSLTPSLRPSNSTKKRKKKSKESTKISKSPKDGKKAKTKAQKYEKKSI